MALRSCPPGTRAVELGGSGFSAGDWGDGLQSSQTSFHPHRFPEADTAHFHLLLCPAVTHPANKGKWNTAHRSWPPATRYSMHGDSLAGRAPQPSLAGPGHSPFSPRPGTGSDDKWLRNDDRERLRTVGQGRGRGAGGNTRGSQSFQKGWQIASTTCLDFFLFLVCFLFVFFWLFLSGSSLWGLRAVWYSHGCLIFWYSELFLLVKSISHVWLFATHGLQHVRLPCPSLSPGVCSDSSPLSWWCYLTISSSATLFSFCLQSFPESWSFPVSWLVPSDGRSNFSISPSNEYSELISFRIDWFDLLAVWETLKSLLKHHSSKASVLPCLACFMVQLSPWYMTIAKTIPLTRQIFIGKMLSLLFNMLPRFVIAFLPRSKRLLNSWLKSSSTVISA